MNTKKTVLLTGIVIFVGAFVAADPLMFGLCQNIEVYNEVVKRCIDGAVFPEYVSQLIGFLSLSLIILSLITYRMKDEVFRAWWRFSWWWSLIIIAVTIVLNNSSGGGTLGMDTDFTIFTLTILYTILVATSLVKIFNSYLKTR